MSLFFVLEITPKEVFKNMKNMKKAVSLFGILAITLLASCGKNDSNNSGKPTTSDKTTTTVQGDFIVTYKGVEYEGDSSITVTMGERAAGLVASMLDNTNPEFTFTSSDTTIVTVGEHTGLLTPVKAGTADVKAYVSTDQNKQMTFHVTVNNSEDAVGAFSYASTSYDEKANILASLEKYAVDNYLTGITLFSNGANICYNSRYQPTPHSYVTGYGWGTMREGKLDGDIQHPISGNNASYYQVATTSLPSHANAMNASGSDVSSVYDYISNAYYQTRLNQSSDGYEWYSNTALDDRPLPIDDNGNVITENADTITNTRWRIHVKTGSDFVYRTASTKTKDGVKLSSFDGRAVTKEDYLTPIKYMLTCFNGQYRGAELTKGVSGFAKGAAKYYSLTSKNTTGDSKAIWDDDAWEKAGMDDVVKVGNDDQGDYIEFNLLQPCTQFYAMYYLSSSLYSPLPADFLKLWDAKMVGKLPDGYTPVDTMLSTGAYYITEWETKRITFKKNEQYFYKQDKFADNNTREVYLLPGFQYNEVEDSSVSKSLFLDGSIDSYSPNKDDLKGDFKSTEGEGQNGMSWRKYETKGDSNFKINVNGTSVDRWNELFGTNGQVYQHDASFISNTSNNTFLTHRRYMSDIHFLNFLSYGLNREKICSDRGMKPTQEYFSDNYLIDPESGVSYNSTAAHKAVLADRYNEHYGYNADAAASELRLAMEGSIKEAINNKEIKQNKDGKYILTIVMDWMNTSDLKEYSDVFDSIKEIFEKVNNEDYYGNYILNISTPTPSSDYNQVYNKMKQGEFDLGFGAISGGAMDPINFFEALKSDNSSGFTLNWGPDTSKVNDDDQGDIVYDGKTWSFDGLWNAANTGVLLTKDKTIATAVNVSAAHGNFHYDSIDDSSKSVTYKISFQDLVNAGAKLDSITFEATNSEAQTEQKTITELGATAANNYTISFTLNSDFNTYQEYDELKGDYKTVDSSIATATVSYSVDVNGVTKNFSSTLTLNSYFGITGKK